MQHPFSYPIVGLAVSVFVLIFLVLRTKVHPLIAMILAACIAGVTGGLSVTGTLDTITRGFGSTLGSIGIVIGLGVMMGRILEVSGAAEQIAYSFIRWLGHRREEWALALTGYLVSIPIFVDSAFVILYPIAKALAAKGNRSLLTLGVALAGGLLATHTLVPPTPGPLGAAGLFGVDIGAMMLLGIAIGLPCALGFVIYARWLGMRFPGYGSNGTSPAPAPAAAGKDRALPSLRVSLMPIVVPIALIFLKALLSLFPSLTASSDSVTSAVVQVIEFAGAPVIALCVSTLLAVYTLVPYLGRAEVSARLEEGLQSAGIILMVTGAGGALGFVVRDSGTGAKVAEQIAALAISPIMIPFLVSTLFRFIQGSATVAAITAASITAPILSEIPGVNMLFAAQAAVAGAFFFSYFNDSLFWVVNRMMGIADVKMQLMVWSVPTTIAWAIGGTLVAVLNLAFGAGGTWVDPLIPLAGLAVVVLVIRRR